MVSLLPPLEAEFSAACGRLKSKILSLLQEDEATLHANLEADRFKAQQHPHQHRSSAINVTSNSTTQLNTTNLNHVDTSTKKSSLLPSQVVAAEQELDQLQTYLNSIRTLNINTTTFPLTAAAETTRSELESSPPPPPLNTNFNTNFHHYSAVPPVTDMSVPSSTPTRTLLTTTTLPPQKKPAPVQQSHSPQDDEEMKRFNSKNGFSEEFMPVALGDRLAGFEEELGLMVGTLGDLNGDISELGPEELGG